MMKKKNWKIFYPLLLGVYPALGLIGVNISQMILLAGVRSFLIAFVFSIATYALICWRIKDEHKAALLCGWFFLFFFFYGHFFDALKGLTLFGVVLGRHRFIFPFWLLVFGIGGWLIYKRANNIKLASRTLNIVSVVLVAMPIFQIGLFEWQRNHPASEMVNNALPSQSELTKGVTQLPDVYYIILDGYERGDFLQRDYHLDISGFVQQLEDIGFYVPLCSQSNYDKTALSLSSSLNMNTIEQILPQAVSQGSALTVNEFLVDLSSTIKHSLVRQTFEDMGYKTVSFQNNIWWTEWSDADYFITDNSRPYELVTDFHQITGFEVLFLRTTILRVLEEAGNKWLAPITAQVTTPEMQDRQLVLLALNELGNVPRSIPSPKFVFAHIVSPHSPFIFSPDGKFVVMNETNPGYPDQIQYLNTRLVPLVQNIIKQSETPPIIILQADHGWDNEVRMANFMAIYFPGGGASNLYPTLTPINIFRLVFNTYFDQNFPLLADKSYYSGSYTSFKFSEVTYPCNAGK
ncbi:MAG: hypothetical protein ABSG01_02260 [Anaerolineales bacterium]